MLEKHLMAIVDLELKSEKLDTYQNVKHIRIQHCFTLI